VEDALSSGLNTTVRNAARTYEEYFASSNFSSITQPVKITGMQFRLAVGENWRPVGYVGQAWPDVPISFGSYNVELSKPTAQLVADGEYLSISPTFASYQDGNLTTVRSGALNIAANSFLADGATPALSIHSFGPVISFSTPYTYTPGNGLVMLIRHLGYTGGALNAFFARAILQTESPMPSPVLRAALRAFPMVSVAPYSCNLSTNRCRSRRLFRCWL
jgi:hypothetical protein